MDVPSSLMTVDASAAHNRATSKAVTKESSATREENYGLHETARTLERIEPIAQPCIADKGAFVTKGWQISLQHKIRSRGDRQSFKSRRHVLNFGSTHHITPWPTMPRPRRFRISFAKSVDDLAETLRMRRTPCI
jgi:hypothetical protein